MASSPKAQQLDGRSHRGSASQPLTVSWNDGAEQEGIEVTPIVTGMHSAVTATASTVTRVTAKPTQDPGSPWLPRPLTPYLESIQATSRWRFTLFGGFSAFLCYFFVYFFRKPWQVVGDEEWAGNVTMKEAMLVAQTAGIWIAKIYGWKFNAEVRRSKVTQYLMAAITFAELTLILLGLLPLFWKPFAMFLNGLPLGLVWGLIVTILEGRESSDAMLICLATSFIVGSGYSKNAGYLVLQWVEPYWMPAVVGLFSYPVFLLATWLLYQIPDPLTSEQEARTSRKAMFSNERQFYFFTQWPGLIALWGAFFTVTALREYRDAFATDIFSDLEVDRDTVGTSETVVAVVVFAFTGCVGLVKDNRRAMQVTFTIMMLGSIYLLFTILAGPEAMGAQWWFTSLGIGTYMSYVSYNSILFERLIAYTQIDSTVAYPMVISDSVGYTAALIVAVLSAMDETSNALTVVINLGRLCAGITILGFSLAAAYYLIAFPTNRPTKHRTDSHKRKAKREKKPRAPGEQEMVHKVSGRS